MKRVFILSVLLIMFCLTGCNDKDKIKVKFDCNGIEKEYSVGIDDSFKCSLFAADYEMKIVAIYDDYFTFESNMPLSLIDDAGNIDANSTMSVFNISKGTKTKLAVPLDGLLYTISFKW